MTEGIEAVFWETLTSPSCGEEGVIHAQGS